MKPLFVISPLFMQHFLYWIQGDDYVPSLQKTHRSAYTCFLSLRHTETTSNVLSHLHSVTYTSWRKSFPISKFNLWKHERWLIILYTHKRMHTQTNHVNESILPISVVTCFYDILVTYESHIMAYIIYWTSSIYDLPHDTFWGFHFKSFIIYKEYF